MFGRTKYSHQAKAYPFGNRRSVQAKFLGHLVGAAACENQLNKLLSVLR